MNSIDLHENAGTKLLQQLANRKLKIFPLKLIHEEYDSHLKPFGLTFFSLTFLPLSNSVIWFPN